MSKTILVTGGAGFLGRHLCGKLLENKQNKVICLDNYITGTFENIKEFINNENFIFYEHDITNPLDFIVVDRLDEIYHLACIASPDKYKLFSIETLNTSFIGTQNVLQLAKKHNKCKILFTSTSEVYGDPHVHPQNEEYYGNVNTVGERSCYDEGKRVAETLLYEYRHKHGVDAKIVRLFNTYGPYMDINDGRVITNFIKQINIDNSVIIYGDGNQTRSFSYVDDTIHGLIEMMKSKEYGPINIGNPYCEFTLNKLVKLFEKIMDKEIKVNYIEATENDPKQRKPDITKAHNILGFNPTIDIEIGLKRTIDYFTDLLYQSS